MPQPNTYCKNQNCTHGTDGGRAFYYNCKYCARVVNWRSVACCIECYNSYTEQVLAARAAKRNPDILPDRTDMTKSEIIELMNAPVEEVKKYTLEVELKDYAEDLEAIGYHGVIDKINSGIDADAISNLDIGFKTDVGLDSEISDQGKLGQTEKFKGKAFARKRNGKRGR